VETLIASPIFQVIQAMTPVAPFHNNKAVSSLDMKRIYRQLNKIPKKLKSYKLQANKGFTLIELLLYVSIASIILLITSLFLSTLLQSRIKNQTIAEVEQQGLQVMQIITQTARNAEVILDPAVGESANELKFDVIDVTKDPAYFELSNGVLLMTEGTGSPIALTNSRVNMSGFSASNLSRVSTPGTIRIQFTLTHINHAGRNEYSFTKTFIGSATLRQP